MVQLLEQALSLNRLRWLGCFMYTHRTPSLLAVVRDKWWLKGKQRRSVDDLAKYIRTPTSELVRVGSARFRD